jgi:hypothetical protein
MSISSEVVDNGFGFEPIFVSTPEHGYDGDSTRIQITRGVTHSKIPTFEDGAMITSGLWKNIRPSSIEKLGIRLGIGGTRNTVSVVPVGDRIVEALEPVLTGFCRGDEIQMDDPRISKSIDELASYLSRFTAWRIDEQILSGGGFRVGNGNCNHTTINQKNKKFVGLHIDSWDRAPVHSRWSAQNRICINLGQGERALQFVPMQSKLFASKIKLFDEPISIASNSVEKSVDTSDIARHFLCLHPNTTIIRVKIKPKEAYIAPTENIIHDGCSLTSHPDITFTLRGKIRIKNATAR